MHLHRVLQVWNYREDRCIAHELALDGGDGFSFFHVLRTRNAKRKSLALIICGLVKSGVFASGSKLLFQVRSTNAAGP